MDREKLLEMDMLLKKDAGRIIFVIIRDFIFISSKPAFLPVLLLDSVLKQGVRFLLLCVVIQPSVHICGLISLLSTLELSLGTWYCYLNRVVSRRTYWGFLNSVVT